MKLGGGREDGRNILGRGNCLSKNLETERTERKIWRQSLRLVAVGESSRSRSQSLAEQGQDYLLKITLQRVNWGGAGEQVSLINTVSLTQWKEFGGFKRSMDGIPYLWIQIEKRCRNSLEGLQLLRSQQKKISLKRRSRRLRGAFK